MENYTRTTVNEATRMTPWVVAAVTNLGIISVLGAIGNSACVWCLLQCKRTPPDIKFRLLCVFSLMASCCIITQPIVTFLYYTNHFRLVTIPHEVNFLFSAINSIVLQLERAALATVAVFRLMAVCWPRVYTEWSKLRMMVGVQVGLVLCTFVIWVIYGALTEFTLSFEAGSVMHMDWSADSDIRSLNITVYVLFYALPFFVTLFASVIMVIRLRRRKIILGSSNDSHVDQVVRSTKLIIFINLLIDCPHVFIHMFPGNGIATIIVHMIFFHHLTLEPIIFVASNSSYRRFLVRRLQQLLPKVCSSLLPQLPDPACPQHDTLELQATYRYTTIAE